MSTRPKPLRPAPDVGDILWCRFPEAESIRPAVKPRPCLVIWVSDPPETSVPYRIRVVYGTSRLRGACRENEFDIDPIADPEAGKLAGLSWPTRFDFAKAVVVNYDDMFFAPAPGGSHLPVANTPKLGTLHPKFFAAARRAAESVVTRGKRGR